MVSVRSMGLDVNVSAPFFQRMVISQLSATEFAPASTVMVFVAGS